MMRLDSYLAREVQVTAHELREMCDQQAITVNGELVTHALLRVPLYEGDEIVVIVPGDEDEVASEWRHTVTRQRHNPPCVVLFNKPRGFVVSKDDEHNRTIFELLPDSWLDEMRYIGRLDKDSHGLLMLTNVRQMVEAIEHPRNKVEKHYRVRIDKMRKSGHTQRVKKGIVTNEEGERLPQKISDEEREKLLTDGFQRLTWKKVFYSKEGGRHYLDIMLTAGKKRHIRRVCKALGYKVLDLKRVRVGIWQLGSIKPGKWKIERLSRKELEKFL